MLKEPLLKALARLLTVAQASMSLNRNRQRSFLVIVPFCWDEEKFNNVTAYIRK